MTLGESLKDEIDNEIWGKMRKSIRDLSWQTVKFSAMESTSNSLNILVSASINNPSFFITWI